MEQSAIDKMIENIKEKTINSPNRVDAVMEEVSSLIFNYRLELIEMAQSTPNEKRVKFISYVCSCIATRIVDLFTKENEKEYVMISVQCKLMMLVNPFAMLDNAHGELRCVIEGEGKLFEGDITNLTRIILFHTATVIYTRIKLMSDTMPMELSYKTSKYFAKFEIDKAQQEWFKEIGGFINEVNEYTTKIIKEDMIGIDILIEMANSYVATFSVNNIDMIIENSRKRCLDDGKVRIKLSRILPNLE